MLDLLLVPLILGSTVSLIVVTVFRVRVGKVGAGFIAIVEIVGDELGSLINFEDLFAIDAWRRIIGQRAVHDVPVEVAACM